MFSPVIHGANSTARRALRSGTNNGYVEALQPTPFARRCHHQINRTAQ